MQSSHFVSGILTAFILTLLSALPGGTQDPTLIPKYEVPLVIPPAMPRTSKNVVKGGKNIDYYEIAVRQFEQQVLPPGMPETTVWSYGSVAHPWTFHYPAFTIEAKHDKPVRIKWINDLVDAEGNYLPHLLPVDQTLHWANPLGECADGTFGTDCGGLDPTPYTGPVPIVTHVHGAHSKPQYDGYPEAWYLPDALDLPPAPARSEGSLYEYFQDLATAEGNNWGPGYAVFEYANDQNAATLWYHDHALGMTRLNVYAGPAGFYLLRGGEADLANEAMLPGPAPELGDLPDTRYYEIPIAIQDRSFDADGSLFYPDNRAFFEGLDPSELDIPFFPDPTSGLGISDIAAIWNPEFFGNTMVVNGATWPYLEVEPRRYRFRLLNGSQSRFLILTNDAGLPIWQIGSDGGFLPEVLELDEVRLGPAERADVIMDFGELPIGTTVTLLNLGPDEPFGGGDPDIDFEPSDPETTGQVMQFIVVGPGDGLPDTSADPALDELILPTIAPLDECDGECPHRTLSLAELDSQTVFVVENADGSISEDPIDGEPFGPRVALLGTYDPIAQESHPMAWADALTENPEIDATEVWEIHNFTGDAHPIHVHQVQFEVLNRQNLFGGGGPWPPDSWEEGFKDTVIAPPGQITRIKAYFDLPGLYVWHCHILEHEDNEMMRPFHVGEIPDDLPVPKP
jgi:spore coat protein A